MKRIDLFEFEDLPWFPDTIRRGGTDYLRYFLNATKFYDGCAPLISELLDKTKEKSLLDVCSGGGGGMASLANALDKLRKDRVPIVLSDKFPNLDAFRYVEQESKGRIGFVSTSVDALHLPTQQPGLVTMCSAIHHFSPAVIEQFIRGAASQQRSLAIFDGGNKNPFMFLGLAIVQPVTFALFTPFFRPFKLSRLFFTYLLPAIPLMTLWDGISSILRLYKPEELLAIAKKAAPNYVFEAGKKRNRLGFSVTWVTGRPA